MNSMFEPTILPSPRPPLTMKFPNAPHNVYRKSQQLYANTWMYKNTPELYLLTISNDWYPFLGENIL